LFPFPFGIYFGCVFRSPLSYIFLFSFFFAIDLSTQLPTPPQRKLRAFPLGAFLLFFLFLLFEFHTCACEFFSRFFFFFALSSFSSCVAATILTSLLSEHCLLGSHRQVSPSFLFLCARSNRTDSQRYNTKPNKQKEREDAKKKKPYQRKEETKNRTGFVVSYLSTSFLSFLFL
jgi:multidrug efflux pump subunit AcrB